MGDALYALGIGFSLAVVGCDEPAGRAHESPVLVRAPADPGLELPDADAGAVDAGATDAGGECWMAEVQPAVEEYVSGELYQDIGSYLNDDFYRGTASVTDNASVLSGEEDGSLSGNVIARTWEQRANEYLVVVGVESPSWFDMGASFGEGGASAVKTKGGGGHEGGGEIDATLSFFPAPPAIAFDFHATGTWPGTSEALVVDGNLDLQRVDDSEITLEDIETFWAIQSQTPQSFIPVGTRAERLVHATAKPSLVCHTSVGYCRVEVEFEALEFVQLHDLTKSGYEDVKILNVAHCCVACDVGEPWECTEGVSGYEKTCAGGML